MSIVYLMQHLTGEAEAQLIPVIAYPEMAEWQPQSPIHWLMEEATAIAQAPRLLAEGTGRSSEVEFSSPSNFIGSDDEARSLISQRQIVLPLMHEEVVLGVLVVGRGDRGWSAWEQIQIEQIANTLAIACFLDQRYQWLALEQQQRGVMQTRQHDQFDNLLHQFRNSLTALQTFGKLLVRRLLPGDSNREVATSIVRETGRLKELSQHLAATVEAQAIAVQPILSPAAGDVTSPKTPLLLAASSLTETPLVLAASSVAAVLEPLLASAKTIASDRNLILNAAIDPFLPPIWANAQALREVLNNLIENALKYTPAGGQVFVEAARVGSQVEIAVSNTGHGIPAPDLLHIFERHYRGVQAHTDIPGTGLGLAIAKTLVEQMQGEIWVFSPGRAIATGETDGAIDNGTTFVVRLAGIEARDPT